jgi:transportin-3
MLTCRADLTVMDDYVHTFMAYLTQIPETILNSSALQLALSQTISALTCPAPETTLVCLDTLVLVTSHLGDPRYTPHLQPLLAQFGSVLVGLLVAGVVGGFPEEGVEQVRTVLGALSVCAPAEEVYGWLNGAVGQIPGHVVPTLEKEKFLTDVQR